jgi:hypothetical protein
LLPERTEETHSQVVVPASDGRPDLYGATGT